MGNKSSLISISNYQQVQQWRILIQTLQQYIYKMFRRLFRFKKTAFSIMAPFALYSLFAYNKTPILNATVDQVSPVVQIKSSQQSDAKGGNVQSFMKITKISQIPLFEFTKSAKRVVIIADFPYTPQFQQRILKNVKSILKTEQAQNIQIYRANILDPVTHQKFKQAYDTSIKEQTIVLLKNQYQDNFLNIDFDMFVQHPKIMKIFMDKINFYNKSNEAAYLSQLRKMGPNQAYLIYTYEDTQSPQEQLKRKLTAKYIQMQLLIHSLDKIKVFSVDSSVLKQHKIVTAEKAKANTLHLIRKHNEFTHATPNLSLKLSEKDDSQFYHVIQDFGLHTKKGQITIQHYLSKIQIFNSMALPTPFVIVLTIDKNKIYPMTYKKLMSTFKTIKKQNKFPQVGMILRFGEIGYQGNQYKNNQQFNIRMTNIAELDNEVYIHQIKNHSEAQQLQINQNNWLRHSHQYQYNHMEVNSQLVYKFMQQSISKQIPEYYKSDAPDPFYEMDNVTAKDFQNKILKNQKNHFVFQYDKVTKQIMYEWEGLNMLARMSLHLKSQSQSKFEVSKLNVQQNLVQGQLYSPSPRYAYYKNQWKKYGPVQLPLGVIRERGAYALYKICQIIASLNSVDPNKIQKSVQQSKKWIRQDFFPSQNKQKLAEASP